MPELPDIEAYLTALRPRLLGATLDAVHVLNPFLLRTVAPQVEAARGRYLVGLCRVGKRIVFEFEEELFFILHLMIAGRLHWRDGEARAGPRARSLATFAFSTGTLVLTEAGSKRRASLHVVEGRAALLALDPGGLEVLQATPEEFRAALLRENHTLKRALTDPALFSGIGNAYSDEILHRARLSPFSQTGRLAEAEIETLREAAVSVLTEWTERLRQAAEEAFPEKVTAFRPEMAVHGRFGLPCTVCGTAIQRIRYAENECDYCPRCQTEGRVLADRSLSRLLKADWPRTVEELERRGAASQDRYR